jgi:hypothetical protein
VDELGRSSRQATLAFLLERLNWPVRLVRWRAAKEIANLMASPRYRSAAIKSYLAWMKLQRFESQITSALAVLFCLPRGALPAFSDVYGHISRPSVLADLMLEHAYGDEFSKREYLKAHSGPVPESFAADGYFLRHKGAHVPPILSRNFEELEQRSGLPFSKQWAFEWRVLMDTTQSPYSGFPHFFLDASTRRTGVSGQFSPAQCHVYRSAYLRTLALAVANWKMPLTLAKQYSTYCLPLNRGLADFAPISRPTWLGDIPEQCAAPSSPLVDLGKQLVARGASKGSQVVHLESPIREDVARYGDLSLTALLTSDDFVPDLADAEPFSRGASWILPDGISFSGLLPSNGLERYMQSGVLGFYLPTCLGLWPMPAGFWHGDYFASGIMLPASYLFEGATHVVCDQHEIRLDTASERLGAFALWHDRWTPLYPEGGNTRCGLLTDIEPKRLKTAQDLFGMRLGWMIRLRLWKQETEYAELESTVRQEFFPA